MFDDLTFVLFTKSYDFLGLSYMLDYSFRVASGLIGQSQNHEFGIVQDHHLKVALLLDLHHVAHKISNLQNSYIIIN